MRLTLDAGDDKAPRWSADGQWLMFSSNRLGVDDIYKGLASGDGADELVFESETQQICERVVARRALRGVPPGRPGSTVDLYALPLIGDRRPIVVDSTTGFSNRPTFLPTVG